MTDKEHINENDRLVELKGSGYEIVKDEPDIRGWEVKDIQGRRFGKVDELLFDKESHKVRYIVLDLKENILNLKPRKVLIPIGLAQLDEHLDEVIFPQITAIHLTELPDYKKAPVLYDDEVAIRQIFTASGFYGASEISDNQSIPTIDNRGTFYQHGHFDEKYLHERRPPSSSERPAGNNPSAQHSTDLKSFEEGTIEFTERKEIPIITKEAKVVEEISLNKKIEEHDTTIRDSVRKTDVRIEHDDKDNKDKG